MKSTILVFFTLLIAAACSTLKKPEPIPPAPPIKLVWEESKPERAAWSKIVTKNIEANFADYAKAKDAGLYCTKFAALNHQQQVAVFSQLIVAISKFESSWNPKAGMVETAMGTDPVTGAQVVSSGLLQLSYQDGPNWKTKAPACSALNFAKKNINDVELNLTCGIQILARLIARDGTISSPTARKVAGGRYWSVLWPDKRQGQIKAIVQKLPFCN
jgi:hypothetical protein